MSPGKFLLLTKHYAKRGFKSAYNELISGPKIKTWRNISANLQEEAVPVHIVGGKEHITMTLWMLASWFHFTKRNWKLIFHDDGTLTPNCINRLRENFPEIEVIFRESADDKLNALLSQHPTCKAYRDQFPLALKSFDVPFLTSFNEDGRYLMFDPDVLFFKTPTDILNWVDNPSNECWFNEDPIEPSLISASAAKERFGINLWPKLNSGLCLLNKNIFSFKDFESMISDRDIASGHFWRREQTLIALAVSKHNQGGLLKNTYEVSLGKKKSTTAIARHYVGAVRAFYWSEGVKILKHILLR